MQRAEPIDPDRTAVLIVDPQNEFLSEGGVVGDLAHDAIEEARVIDNLVSLRQAASEAGVPVFYSPHAYTPEEIHAWPARNALARLMFGRSMVEVGAWGAEFHPRLAPDENTFVLAPHKGMSNFWTGDTNIQLRNRGLETIVLAGMTANLCVESHLRDAFENGFRVIVVIDAVAAIGPEELRAARTNYRYLASRVATTDEIVAEFVEDPGRRTPRPPSRPRAGR